MKIIDHAYERESVIVSNRARIMDALARGEHVTVYHPVGFTHGRLANIPGVEYVVSISLPRRKDNAGGMTALLHSRPPCQYKSPEDQALLERICSLQPYVPSYDGEPAGELFIHWCHMPRRQERLSRCEIFHLNMLRLFDVPNRVSVIHIRCAADNMTADMSEAVNALSVGRALIDFKVVPPSRYWEHDTFKECAEYAADTGKFVYYTHFKGVTRIFDPNLRSARRSVNQCSDLDVLYWAYAMYYCLFTAPAHAKAIGPIRTNNHRLLKVFKDISWTRLAKDNQAFFYRGSFQAFDGNYLNGCFNDLGLDKERRNKILWFGHTHTVEIFLSAICKEKDIYSLPASALTMGTPGYHGWSKKLFPYIAYAFSRAYLPRPKIVVSMTSWEKRIGNVAAVIRTLLNQDTPPDAIELNLAKPGFPNGAESLPPDLQELITENALTVYWTEKDTYTFKKIMPTIKRHINEDCVILSCDDDILYGREYISRLMLLLGNNDVACPDNGYVGFKAAVHVRAFSSDFWERLTEEVINLRVNDAYIGAYLRNRNAKCVYFKDPAVLDQLKDFNPVAPNSSFAGGYSKEYLRNVQDAVTRALRRV